MLVNLNDILYDAKKNKYAVGGFNAIDITSARAVIAAAEEQKCPLILMFAEVHKNIVPLEIIGELMVKLAKEASVPVCVHLDHGTDFNYIEKALKIGFTSVMYDGSALPFEENIANTAKVVTLAHSMGATVEAELGQLPGRETGGSEDVNETESNASNLYTNPKLAKEFIWKTNADALAIAFGTAHGVYAKEPVLDYDIIHKVEKEVSVPLVMHGGSGISEEGFKTAIQNGISKINYFTYMSVAGAEAVKEYINSAQKGYYHELIGKAYEGMKEDCKKAMLIFENK